MPAATTIAGMAAQEPITPPVRTLLVERGVRTTLWAPLWDVAACALGAATAARGRVRRWLATVAIETENDRHYGRQLAEIGDSDPACTP